MRTLLPCPPYSIPGQHRAPHRSEHDDGGQPGHDGVSGSCLSRRRAPPAEPDAGVAVWNPGHQRPQSRIWCRTPPNTSPGLPSRSTPASTTSYERPRQGKRVPGHQGRPRDGPQSRRATGAGGRRPDPWSTSAGPCRRSTIRSPQPKTSPRPPDWCTSRAVAPLPMSSTLRDGEALSAAVDDARRHAGWPG